METIALTKADDFLFVEVLIDSANCTPSAKWQTEQNIVYSTLKDHTELGISGSVRHCGCRRRTGKAGCNGELSKATILLLYDSSDGKINADKDKLSSLMSQLGNGSIISGIVPGNVSTYYICSDLTVITDTHPDYKSCMSYKEPDGTPVTITSPTFEHYISGSGGKAGTGTIIGAVVGALAGLGLLAALAWILFRHLKRHREVDDTGTNSGISPIIPGADGFGDAPNSVPPAGTT